MSDVVISVEDLSKRYRLGQIGATTLREGAERFWHRLCGRDPERCMGVVACGSNGVSDTDSPLRQQFHTSSRSNELLALGDVSFEVKRGEVLGIIGRNGAGKSTLLKILSRITEPTSGRAVMRGRVGSLLEVGTGFHPELTGGENIYLSGAILGMRKSEISKRYDEIVDFSGIERFIDTPAKRYSSGMYVRLGFAVAAHLEPEILLIDEVLAVGDAAFQEKCLGKMGEVARCGRTVLFVSHNMAAVEGLCDRCIVLDSGKVTTDSGVEDGISAYLGSCFGWRTGQSLLSGASRSGNGVIYFKSCWIEDDSGSEIPAVRSGQDVVFVLKYGTRPVNSVKNVSVGLGFISDRGQTLAVHYNEYSGETFNEVAPEGEFRCHMKRFPLTPGRYTIGARIVVNGIEADWPRDGVARLVVEQGDFYGTGVSKWRETRTPFLIEASWSS